MIRNAIVPLAALLCGLSSFGHAACVPGKLPSPVPRDPVVRILAAQGTCPKDAVEFVAAVKQSGLRTEPAMVNFASFHSPDFGAFFFFEIVSSEGARSAALNVERGDLLFGHFTDVDADKLVSFKSKKELMIELIAWDPDKQFYNFYELADGGWFYRGDSESILDDVKMLHRERPASTGPFPAKPQLRCSGCHINGGLLQKELAPPHNDWFLRSRNLPLGKLKPDSFVQDRLAATLDAGELSKLVAASARRLADSPKYRAALAARTMQEQLRPLFCPMELNIESDSTPLDDHKPTLTVPSAFFVDPRLASAEISIRRTHYDAAVRALTSRLPDTNPRRADADHGWLTPVKAHSDVVAVDSLIERGIVSRQFEVAVLAVDFTNPVFSPMRCGLLKLVPNRRDADFVTSFQGALRGSSAPGAAELVANLTDPARNVALHEKQAAAFLTACRQQASDGDTVSDWYRLLAQRRVEVATSEISQHPEGSILESPERTVFPSTKPKAVAGRLALTPDCKVR